MRGGIRVRLLLAELGMALIAMGLVPVSASSANISHPYKSAADIPRGSIVSLDPKRSDYVVPANVKNGGRLLGVAVAEGESLIEVDPSTAPGTVQVATTGSASTLVSTLNGDIHVGDQIGLSPFEGIGMKALPGSRVIGLAQTEFNSGTEGAVNEKITDRDGKASTIKAGYVQVNISTGTNATVLSSGNLTSLQRAAKTLTGHTVSTTRVLISLAVATIALLALITLIYASIYGSIISIGRNPLAKYAVFRTLGSVLGLALLTAAVSVLTIFFLLR